MSGGIRCWRWRMHILAIATVSLDIETSMRIDGLECKERYVESSLKRSCVNLGIGEKLYGGRQSRQRKTLILS